VASAELKQRRRPALSDPGPRLAPFISSRKAIQQAQINIYQFTRKPNSTFARTDTQETQQLNATDTNTGYPPFTRCATGAIGGQVPTAGVKCAFADGYAPYMLVSRHAFFAGLLDLFLGEFSSWHPFRSQRR